MRSFSINLDRHATSGARLSDVNINITRDGRGEELELQLLKRVPKRERFAMGDLLKRLNARDALPSRGESSSLAPAVAPTAPAAPPNVTRSVAKANQNVQLYGEGDLHFLVASCLETVREEISGLLESASRQQMTSQLPHGDDIHARLCLMDDVMRRGSAVVLSSLRGASRPKVVSR